ncbi:MAG: hypothetical protein WBB01_26120 [Phormidesmis sp.]
MPRKRSLDSTSDRQRIQFAYNADCDTRIGEVFQYLLKSDKLPSRKGKHKGLDAMTAYWQAFACQENDSLSEGEKQAIALESIEALSQQIDLIRQTYGIESPAVADATINSTEIRQVVAEVVQELVTSGAVSPNVTHAIDTAVMERSPNQTEGVDFDEDALLGGLFEGAEIAK